MALVAGALVLAGASGAQLAVSAKTCPSGYVLANLSWGQKCLHDGEFCKVGNVEYHAYGFDCPADGRLTDYVRSAVSTTTAATTTTTATTTGAAATPTTSGSAPPSKPTIVVLKPLGIGKPNPATGQKAVALARSNTGVAEIASPYTRELGWVAQWRGGDWWVVGVFESQWQKRFVVGAVVEDGQVQTWIEHASPTTAWIRASVRRWKLTTLYTRLTPAAAITLTTKTIGYALSQYTVLGAAAKLAQDTPEPGWYFAFYVQAASGQKLVLTVTGGYGPSKEGEYVDGYGFGGQSQVQQTVPLNLSDWVRSVASAHGWQPSNLP